jgi:hypothetical protein
MQGQSAGRKTKILLFITLSLFFCTSALESIATQPPQGQDTQASPKQSKKRKVTSGSLASPALSKYAKATGGIKVKVEEAAAAEADGKKTVAEEVSSEDGQEKKEEEEEKRGIKITYYNIGQGNCVLMENLETKHAVLVDCGSTESA